MANDPAVRGEFIHKSTSQWSWLVKKIKAYADHYQRMESDPNYKNTDRAKAYLPGHSKQFSDTDLDVLKQCYLQWWVPMRTIEDKDSSDYKQLLDACLKFWNDHSEGSSDTAPAARGAASSSSGTAAAGERPETSVPPASRPRRG